MLLHHLGCWNRFEKLAGMFRNTFHRDKNFEKKDVVKIIAKTGLKHFRWSLIVSIIQTSKFYMELYFPNDVPDS